MGGARNALYLEISCCPPGCRKAREPPSLTPAKTGIALGGRAQLSPSLNTAPAQVASSEPPDLGLSRGLLAGGSLEPAGAGGWEGDPLVTPRPQPQVCCVILPALGSSHRRPQNRGVRDGRGPAEGGVLCRAAGVPGGKNARGHRGSACTDQIETQEASRTRKPGPDRRGEESPDGRAAGQEGSSRRRPGALRLACRATCLPAGLMEHSCWGPGAGAEV